MKISRNSWHYRLLKFFDIGIPHSLCAYFWAVVYALLMAPLTLCAMVAIATLALSPLIMWVYAPLLGTGINMSYAWLVLLSCYLVTRIFKSASHTSFVEVTSGFISAKKNGICPRLEFVDMGGRK